MPRPTPTTPRVSWTRFAGSLIVLAVIVVGLPAALVFVCRLSFGASQPLPGIGSRDEITSWLSSQRSSTEIARVALRVLISLCWVLWAALVVSVLSTILASRPRFDSVRLPRLALFDSIGAWIAAGLVVVASFNPKPAAAAPMTARPVVAAVATPPAEHTALTTRAATTARPGWVVVQSGESIETFTARALGDASRWPEVWQLNRDRVMDDAGTTWAEPWRISAGWELELPALATAAPTVASNALDGLRSAPDPTVAPGAVAVHRIVYGDTLWDIVDAQYGRVDMDLVWFVADFNGITDPNNIPVGFDVQLPPDPQSTADGAAIAALTLAPGAVAVHRIVYGDTLWDIVDAQYGRVDMDLVWFVADFNGITDPNNIPIGFDVQLPPDPQVTAATAPEPPAPAVDKAAVPATPTVEAPPAAKPSWPAPSDAAGPPPTSTPAAPPPTVAPPRATVPPQPAAVTAPPPVEIEATATIDDGGFDFSVRSVWWQTVCGSLLTAGLVTMVRRLRGRRWLAVEPGEQFADPPAVASGTELAAVSTGSPQRVRTLTRLLQTVTPHARELDDPPPVRAVEFDDDRVEVLFAMPAPFPPAGWSTSDGGRSWVHRFDANATSSAVRQLVTPALITVGLRHGGGEVLLDIETAGSTGLVGDHAACLGMARSIALELATYPLGVPMDVCLIGLDVDGVEHCDRTWGATTMTRAVRVAREVLDRTTATGALSLVAARAATDDDQGLLDPQVFVVDRTTLSGTDVDLLDELVGLCQPQAGAALVVIGGHPAARETISVDEAGVASWAGAVMTGPVLPREAVAQVAVMLDHAANAPIEPLATSPLVAALLDSSDEAPEEPADALDDDVYAAPCPDVVVRVMGEVEVTAGDVRLTADQTELLTLLLCLRNERPNADTVAATLDTSRKNIQNRVSALRSRLGVGSDGADLFPAAVTGRGADGRYRLSKLMMTDVDLLEHRYQASLQLPSQDALAALRGGLELMSGPAFRSGKGYSWAAPHGVQARIAAIVNAYATRLMQLALEAEELDVVLETVRRAETVIDDVVAETPLHRVEREIADATGHPKLREGVASALRRLSAYVDETDQLVPDSP